MIREIISALALFSILIGATWMVLTTNEESEWQYLSVTETIVDIISISGINYALSDNKNVYSCPSTMTEQNECSFSPHTENVNFVKENSNKDNLPACTSLIQEPLNRLFQTDESVVACALMLDIEGESVDRAFIVDQEGKVWRWIPSQHNIIRIAFGGGVIGGVVGLCLFALYLMVSRFLKMLSTESNPSV